MSLSGFVLTSRMRGCLVTPAVYAVGLLMSPPDSDFGIISQHESIRARLHGDAIDPNVLTDEAVGDPVRQITHRGAFKDDAVLDLRILNLHVVHDRGERPDIRVHDPRAPADDGGPSDCRTFDHGSSLDDDLALDPALGIDRTLNAPLLGLEDQAIGFEHVLELAGVFPPALDDVRAHGQAPIDQVLDGVSNLELVAKAGLDPVHRFEDLRAEHVHADEREIADVLLRLLDEPHNHAVFELCDTEHLRVRDLGEQDLRRRLFARKFLHEVRDALVQQVVAQVHDERLGADERLADFDRVAETERRFLLDVLDAHAPP